MAVETICNFFKYGYCKFKMSCKNKHVTTVCDDEKCNPIKCEKRHPRLCKYISNYGSCKLGSICAYSHDHRRKNENDRLEKKLDELIAMVTKKDDIILKCEKKIEDLMQINRKKDDIIGKLVNDVKELDKIVKEKISCKVSNTSSEELPSKTKDVTSVNDDKKKSLRSFKKKESKEVEFSIACLKIVDETEENMKNETDIEIIRQKYLGCTEKIEKEVISHNVVADFGLTLMLTNMKLVNENSPKEMIILRIDCLRKGLSNFKLKMENDGKK